MEKIRIGLDIHGVIDKHPKVFAAISNALVAAGHEVHIITGPLWSEELKAELEAFGIKWTHFCSITQYRIDMGYEVTFDEKGNPWMDPTHWNSAKGEYCAEQEIDIHIDDSEEYGKFFSTLYFQKVYQTGSQRKEARSFRSNQRIEQFDKLQKGNL